jgi:hypothetical protein
MVTGVKHSSLFLPKCYTMAQKSFIRLDTCQFNCKEKVCLLFAIGEHGNPNMLNLIKNLIKNLINLIKTYSKASTFEQKSVWGKVRPCKRHFEPETIRTKNFKKKVI